jgi:hypothetical protein
LRWGSRAAGATILSDGRGLPAARMLGGQAASGRFVALVDADVVLHRARSCLRDGLSRWV